MIEPVSDAWTISVLPFLSATKARISSAALPNVAFRRPPMLGPAFSESCSVARPMIPASGTIPSAQIRKTHALSTVDALSR